MPIPQLQMPNTFSIGLGLVNRAVHYGKNTDTPERTTHFVRYQFYIWEQVAIRRLLLSLFCDGKASSPR